MENFNSIVHRVLQRFRSLATKSHKDKNVSQWRLSKKQAIHINELYVKENRFQKQHNQLFDFISKAKSIS